MLKGYYDTKRFRYIHNELETSSLFERKGSEKIRKTACFYGEKFNVYIDTSDGVNEDLDIYEYCGRMLKVIDDTRGKPFLFFKAAYSPERSKNVVEMANSHGGKVIPFFKWNFNDHFYFKLLPHLQEYREKKQKSDLQYDIGYFAGLDTYDYPKPNADNHLIAWTDHKYFGFGSSKNMGSYRITTRQSIFSQMKKSELDVLHCQTSYDEYLKQALTCRTIFNPPGIGEYTSRMVDACALGKCIILRKTGYDNGISWKEYLPEVDFTQPSWQEEYQNILDKRHEWEEKSLYYYEHCWSPRAIVDYLVEKINS